MMRFLRIALGLAVLLLAGCSSETSDRPENQADSRVQPGVPNVTNDRQTAANDPALVTLESGVRYIDLQEGDGHELVYGDYVKWEYKAFFADQSGLIKAQGLANSAELEDDYYAGQVGVTGLPGLTEGVIGMKLGGIRRIHVPWELGWGDAGPFPKANLIFEIQDVELISKDEAQEWQSREYTRRQYIEQETRRRQDSIRQDSIARAGGETGGE